MYSPPEENLNTKSELDRLKQALQDAKLQMDSLREAVQHWQTTAETVSSVLEKTYNSNSWKVTLPARELVLFTRKVLKRFNFLQKSDPPSIDNANLSPYASSIYQQLEKARQVKEKSCV